MPIPSPNWPSPANQTWNPSEDASVNGAPQARFPRGSEALNLGGRLHALFPALRETFPSRIGLRLEVPPTHLWIRMDQEILDELIRELLSATVAAIPKYGTIWMTVWRGTYADHRPAACFRIEGTGTGNRLVASGLSQRPELERFCDALNLPGLAGILAQVRELDANVQVDCVDEVATTFSLRFPVLPEPGD